MTNLKIFFIVLFILLSASCTSSIVAKKTNKPIITQAPPVVHVGIEKLDTYSLNGNTYSTSPNLNVPHYEKQGKASYYAQKFNGRRTASGEVYRSTELTAAHKTLPFGTHVLVTNLKNNRKVIVRINDRGPYHGSRIIDLSRAAASELGIVVAGTGHVKVEKLHLVNNN